MTGHSSLNSCCSGMVGCIVYCCPFMVVGAAHLRLAAVSIINSCAPS